MRILYGVCGEGFGHSSRAKEIIRHLESKGHKVLVLTYGKAYKALKYLHPIKVYGVKLSFKKGKLSLKHTILQNLSIFPKNLWNVWRVKKKIDKFSPEVCISDMDPFVPINSIVYNCPLISLDNQHRLTHLKLDVPLKYKNDFLIAKSAIDACVSRAKAYVILSFTKGNIIRKDAYVVSPILRKEVTELKPHKGSKILVYLTRPDRKIASILKTIPQDFVVYGFNKENKEANLEFKKIGKSFLRDLNQCKAVIATSGFTLMSEALYLKKPYFAIPQKGQFEQTLNSLFLKGAGLGDFSEDPTREQIVQFLNNLAKYEKKLKTHKMNPSEAITVLDKLLEKIKKKA